MTFTHFEILYPEWLLLLPPIWAMIWLLRRSGYRDSMWSRVCERHLLLRMHGAEPEGEGRQNRYWILALLFSLGIVAAAGPSWSRQAHAEAQPISARVLVLELSQAMLIEDVRPDRFSAALHTARKILDSDFNGETGLVVFAGAAFVVSPLSRDANALHAFLDALDPGTMPLDGSRVDLALNLARDLLDAAPGGAGQILLIGSRVENPEVVLQAALRIARQGNSISVLAIGNDEGGPVKGSSGGLLREEQGRYLISKPDFAILQGIADLGNGKFFKTAESTASTDLFIRGSGLTKSMREHPVDPDKPAEFANDGYWMVWLMLPFCLLLFRRNQLWLLLLVCILPMDQAVEAASPDSFWQHRERQAYDAFQVENYTRALELSRDPLLRGSALYRQGRYEEAVSAFEDADTAASHYNRGNALSRLQRFAEAIQAFDETLKRNPAHEAAIHNKRLIEFYLEHQANADATGDADRSEASDDSDIDDSQARLGMAGERITNPGEDSQSGSGLGASLDPGQVDLSENYHGGEQQLERFTLREAAANPVKEEIIEAWIEALPQASSELYRRKFLRDFQRQNRQER